MFNLIIIFTFFISYIFGQDETFDGTTEDYQNLKFVCGTASLTEQQKLESKAYVDSWLSVRENRNEPVHVRIIFHIIHASNGQGDVNDSQIESQVESMQEEFAEHQITFSLDSINRVENDDWFSGWYTENSDIQGMQQLSYDPYHFLNIYTARLNEPGSNYFVGGYTYWPLQMSEGSYQQGFTLDYRCLPGESQQWPKAATHEAGHYFGLAHTFDSDCNAPDDMVDDTPRNHSDNLYSCNPNLDSCPDDPGNDPVYNHMTYSGTDCPYEFTLGQEDRMHAIIAQIHPSLLENSPDYPSLYLSTLNFQLDTDGDGVFNPGESARVRVNIGNSWGADAEGVTVILRTDDSRLNILDSMIVFTNSITAGEISFTLFDWFEVEAVEGSQLGSIPCELYITTNSTENPYEITEEVFIDISINQYGFPKGGHTIKSSPMITDLDNNGLKEIYFGSDDGNMYATMVAGTDVAGFPFETGDDVKSSPAVGDVDNDGEQELVFGSKDRTLYIVNKGGIQESSYIQTGYIIGAPALVDLDGDADLEIIFVTQNGSEGKVYAIHHNGTDVTGFPLDIAEKMVVGPAVADLEGDGVFDIAVTTWGEHIYAIDAAGNVKEGFPFAASRRFNAPPVVADFDGDGDLEIAAGNDDGNLYVLHHDASLMVEYSVGDDIRGGLAVADLDSDGSLELVFTGYDDHIHVWSPSLNVELSGWPVDMGSNSLTGPVIADLDNDGDLEVVSSTKTGDIYALEHDGSLVDYFPFNVAGNVESSPAIGDLDNDGDFELIFGTTMGLQVLDIKSEAGNVSSWKLHRGNNYRNGYYGLTMASVKDDLAELPEVFSVSKNYPNPFNPKTSVRISTVEEGRLMVNIYDLSGRLVNSLINENVKAGVQTLTWDGSNQFGQLVPTGVYFLQVVSGVSSNLQKMALVK